MDGADFAYLCMLVIFILSEVRAYYARRDFNDMSKLAREALDGWQGAHDLAAMRTQRCAELVTEMNAIAVEGNVRALRAVRAFLEKEGAWTN